MLRYPSQELSSESGEWVHESNLDLDGTLTDPACGITRCMVYALERLGFAAPDPAYLRKYIGPPLRAVFGELLATSDAVLVERAVAAYRERFGEVGLYENELYPGTAESLEGLSGSGDRLFVGTAKAEVYARRIVEHFGLSPHFVDVYGAALSGVPIHIRPHLFGIEVTLSRD